MSVCALCGSPHSANVYRSMIHVQQSMLSQNFHLQPLRQIKLLKKDIFSHNIIHGHISLSVSVCLLKCVALAQTLHGHALSLH